MGLYRNPLDCARWRNDKPEACGTFRSAVALAAATAGMDIGEGVTVRYDEGRREVVGLTLIGLRSRLVGSLSGAYGPPAPSRQ